MARTSSTARLHHWPWLLVTLLFAMGGNCTDAMLEPLSANYRAEHDYGSLQGIATYLRPGAHSRSYVEELLGEGVSTEIAGQVFYPSHETEPNAEGEVLTRGLLVDYRDTTGHVTATLQAKELVARPYSAE